MATYAEVQPGTVIFIAFAFLLNKTVYKKQNNQPGQPGLSQGCNVLHKRLERLQPADFEQTKKQHKHQQKSQRQGEIAEAAPGCACPRGGGTSQGEKEDFSFVGLLRKAGRLSGQQKRTFAKHGFSRQKLLT